MKSPTTIAEAIKKPMEWPRWPFLPVVNRSIRRTGLVFENGLSNQFRFLPDANMFDPAKKLKDAIELDAESLDSEGWEID